MMLIYLCTYSTARIFMIVCKGVCVKFKAKDYKGYKRYALGQKLCPICGIFITYNDTRCPCCKCKLRITPKGSKARKQNAAKNFVWQ
jgi:hypothetical protein